MTYRQRMVFHISAIMLFWALSSQGVRSGPAIQPSLDGAPQYEDLCVTYALSPLNARPTMLLAGAGILSDVVPAKGQGGGPTPQPDLRRQDEELKLLMLTAEKHYTEGQRQLAAGELAKARASFDMATDLILKSGYNLQQNATLRSYFSDLIEKIQTSEAAFLSQGGNMQDQGYEPALIDELENIRIFPLEIDPRLKELVDEDMAKTIYDIPVIVNDKVLYFLNYFRTQARKKFTEGLMRSGRYKEMIARIFKEESLPLDLMYMGLVESLFNPRAFSRARAKGMWQFISSTGRLYGLRISKLVDERSDPEKSTRAAARHIKDLYETFGDWYLVMASYNAGKGRILRAIERSGKTDFWSLEQYLPRETANHVPAVLASIIIAKSPDKYGFPSELESPLELERILIRRPTSLSSIAKKVNLPLKTIRDLNPDLRLMTVPANYQIKLPKGIASTMLASLSPSRAVVKSQTTPRSASARWQPIRSRSGQGVLLSSSGKRTRVSAASNVGQTKTAAPTKVVHKVRKGESLYEIANRYNTSVSSVQHWNKLPSSRIYPGDKLTIFVSR